MKTRIAAIALIAVTAFAADDLLAKYKLPADQLKNAAFDALTNDSSPSGFGAAPRGFKEIPKGAQVAAVKAIGALLKGWYGTDDFKQRYAQWRQDQLPEKPKPIKTLKEQLAEMKANLDAQRATMKDLPASAQPQMNQLLADMEKSQTEMLTKSGAELEKARFDGETKALAEAEAANPVDPKEKLKKALKGFLDATRDVDFGAATVSKEGRKVFKLTEHEQQNDLWKLSYRAGKEVTEAARSFATTWLAELK